MNSKNYKAYSEMSKAQKEKLARKSLKEFLEKRHARTTLPKEVSSSKK